MIFECPNISNSVIKELNEIGAEYGVNSALRAAHLLSQCAHESANFTKTEENLNYSKERLLVVFPHYFNDLDIAAQYEHNPEKLGNYIYANRMGNGPPCTGDGYRYRGRGYLQLTGVTNYRSFNRFIKNNNVVNSPELVSTLYPLVSSAWFFNCSSIWPLCDKGGTDEDIKAVTKRVNGGVNGLAERSKLFKTIFSNLKVLK